MHSEVDFMGLEEKLLLGSNAKRPEGLDETRKTGRVKLKLVIEC